MDNLTKTRTIISAQPGWFIAMYVGQHSDRLVLDPIIAWEITHFERHIEGHGNHVDRRVMRLTTSGGDYDYGQYVIKRPDGLFEDDDDCLYRNETDALAALRELST
jgi:hypothetical protein